MSHLFWRVHILFAYCNLLIIVRARVNIPAKKFEITQKVCIFASNNKNL